MNRSRPRISAFATVATVALLTAACQAGGAGSPSAAASAASSDAPSEALLSVMESAGVGEHVVDASGQSLYVFLTDSPGESACSDGCAVTWPPATVEEGASLSGGEGVTAEIGTIERDDGTLQLTLGGWPLYRYAVDADPGDVTGEGVGGVWFVARPDGSLPDAASTSPEASPDASAGTSADESGSDDPYDY